MTVISTPEVFIETKRYSSLPFTEVEIVQLARAGVIDFVADDIVFRIVGAVILNRRIIYVLPKFETEENCSAAVGQRYIRIIDRYFRSGSGRNRMGGSDEATSVLVTSFLELNGYYKQFGLFKERYRSDVTASARKTNWSKTLQRNETVFSSHHLGSASVTSALYSKPISVTSFEHEGQISRLFALVTSILATHLAPILRMSHPLALGASLDQAITELKQVVKQSKVYCRLLRAKAEGESGPRKRALTVLFTLLKDDAVALKTLVSRKAFVFGIRDFEYVWEEACLTSLGAERNSRALAQPKMQCLTEIEVSISSQRADGIVVSLDPHLPSLIVDAKYYTPRDEKVRFSSADLMKQFGYGLSARSTFERASIGNALMLPGKPGRSRCTLMGKVRLELDDSVLSDVDDVHVLQIDHNVVFCAYMDNTADASLLADVYKACGFERPNVAAAATPKHPIEQDHEEFDDDGDYLYPNCFLRNPTLVDKIFETRTGRMTEPEWNASFIVGFEEGSISPRRLRYAYMADFLEEAIASGKEVFLAVPFKNSGLIGYISWGHIRRHDKTIRQTADGLHVVLYLECTESEWCVYASAKARIPLTRLYPAVLRTVSNEIETAMPGSSNAQSPIGTY